LKQCQTSQKTNSKSLDKQLKKNNFCDKLPYKNFPFLHNTDIKIAQRIAIAKKYMKSFCRERKLLKHFNIKNM